MEDILGYVGVPAIMVVSFFVGAIFKRFVSNEYHKYIPEIVGLTGIVVAILTHIFIPEYLDTTNILDTVVIGIVSGLSSTGVHQIFKQLERD